MMNFIKRYYIPLILVTIFMAPGVTAMYFYYHPQLLGQAAVNKGQFIQPAVFISELTPSQKWHLTYWIADTCDAACEEKLEKLAKIRLALGRKLYHVELNVVVLGASTSISPDLIMRLKERDIVPVIRKKMPDLKQKLPIVLIANPDGYLILAYQSDVRSQDIFHDLKLLASTSEKG